MTAFDVFVDESSRFLVEGHGFERKGKVFLREDSLLRRVQYAPSRTAKADAQRFDIWIDVGVAGVSELGTGPGSDFVRASVGKIHRMSDRQNSHLEIDGSARGSEVAAAATGVLRKVCESVILPLSGPEALLDLVYVQRERFKQFDLWPWNEVPRLELAGVYAAHLGRLDVVEEVRSDLAAFAAHEGYAELLSRAYERIEVALQAAAR